MIRTTEDISIPDSKMAREATEFIRDTESDLLFNHSSRVYQWAALAGQKREVKADAELLYIGCMFHDIGLTREYCSCDKRFEVDGANEARKFLESYGIELRILIRCGQQLPSTPRRVFRNSWRRK